MVLWQQEELYLEKYFLFLLFQEKSIFVQNVVVTMWSKWLNKPLPTAVHPTFNQQGLTAKTIILILLRALTVSTRSFWSFQKSFFLFVCLLKPLLTIFNVLSLFPKLDDSDTSKGSSPFPETALTLEDPTFVTAQGSSFFIGDGSDDTSSISYNIDSQSKEDLAGSYRYTATEVPPPQAEPTDQSTSKGEF